MDEAELDSLTRDRIVDGLRRAWGDEPGDAFPYGETTPDGIRDMAPVTFDVVRFVVALKCHLDLDWVVDQAFIYTGE